MDELKECKKGKKPEEAEEVEEVEEWSLIQTQTHPPVLPAQQNVPVRWTNFDINTPNIIYRHTFCISLYFIVFIQICYLLSNVAYFNFSSQKCTFPQICN